MAKVDTMSLRRVLNTVSVVRNMRWEIAMGEVNRGESEREKLPNENYDQNGGRKDVEQ